MSTSTAISLLSDLDALARGLDWASGAGFYFLVVDNLRLREKAISDVRDRLQKRRMRFLPILSSRHGLLDQLRRITPLQPAEVLVVTGIESLVRDASEDATIPFVRNLNATRDAFRLVAPCPILFVVPTFVLAVLATGAPDFFSTRSGVYHYMEKADPEMWRIPQPLVRGSGIDLPSDEIIQRIADVEQMLAMLPVLESPNTRHMYFGFAQRLTDLLLSQFDLDRATAVATDAYELAGDAQPEQALQFALRLGQIAALRGDVDGAERYVDVVAAIAARIGGSSSAILALGIRAHADSLRGRFDDAARAYEEALKLSREMADSATCARFEMALGNIRRQQGRAEEAVHHLRRSEKLAETAGERPLLAEIRKDLATSLLQTGRLLEADEAIETSIREFERAGDNVQLSLALTELGDIRTAQVRFAEAEETYQRSLEKVEASRILPSRALQPLLRLIDLKKKQGDAPAAAEMAERALALIDRTRLEIPDATAVENALRSVLNELRGAPAS